MTRRLHPAASAASVLRRPVEGEHCASFARLRGWPGVNEHSILDHGREVRPPSKVDRPDRVGIINPDLGGEPRMTGCATELRPAAFLTGNRVSCRLSSSGPASAEPLG